MGDWVQFFFKGIYVPEHPDRFFGRLPVDKPIERNNVSHLKHRSQFSYLFISASKYSFQVNNVCTSKLADTDNLKARS